MTAKHNPELPLLEFFEKVYRPLKLLAAKAGSIQQYHVALRAFDKFLKRAATLADLNEEQVTTFMAKLLEEGKSAVTVNMKVSYLKTLARFAKRKKYIRKSLYDVDKLRVERRVPTAWTVAEMDALIRSCREQRGWYAGIKASVWWEMLVLVAFDTGARRRAVLEAGLDWIDFQAATLTLPPQYAKNRTEQIFKLSHQTLEIILASIPPQRKRLFAWPDAMCQRTFYDHFREILKRAGLPADRRDKLHKLRRTTASHIAAKYDVGRAIKQLGHADASCIQRYIDPRFLRDHDATDALPRPAWDNPREVIVKADSPTVEMGKPLETTISSELVGRNTPIGKILDGAVPTPDELQEAIDQTGLSLSIFCKVACVNYQTLSGVLEGERPLTANYLGKMLIAFGYAAERLSVQQETLPFAQHVSERAILDADPVLLVNEFWSTQPACYKNVYKNMLVTTLVMDGAVKVRDLRPDETLSKIAQRVTDGAIMPGAANHMRMFLVRYIRWLATVKCVRGFERALVFIENRKNRRLRAMGDAPDVSPKRRRKGGAA